MGKAAGPMPHAVLVAALAAVGLGISAYIWFKQVTTGPVLCIGRGCATVIRSRFGRMLAIPNGAWGIAYFGGIGVAAALATLHPAWAPSLNPLGLAASTIALGLHAYLTYLQLLVLRALCSWCLASAALTLAILLLLTSG